MFTLKRYPLEGVDGTGVDGAGDVVSMPPSDALPSWLDVRPFIRDRDSGQLSQRRQQILYLLMNIAGSANNKNTLHREIPH